MKNIVTKPAPVGPKTVEKNTLTRARRRIADLQWRIQFTEMKLNDWSSGETNAWFDLIRMQEQAKRELSAIAS